MATRKLLSETRRLRPFLSPLYSSITVVSHAHVNSISARSFFWRASKDSPEIVTHSPVFISEESSNLNYSNLESLDTVFDGSSLAEEAISRSGWYIPVDVVIAFLDGIHDFTGLPWWLTIPISTLALRISLLPILFLQLKKLEKIAELFPKLPPPLPPPLSGISFKEQYMLFRKQRMAIGCPSFLWSVVAVAVQAPCFLLWMTSIREMSLDHHPGFDSGGILWFANLTDYPSGALGFVFPMLVSGLHFVNVQISFQTFKGRTMSGILGFLQKYYKLWLEIITIPIFLVGFCVPQGTLIYWVTNSSLNAVQQLLLKHHYIHRMLGLRALPGSVPHHQNLGLSAKSGPATHDISAGELLPDELLTLGLQHLVSGRQDRALTLLRLATEKDPGLARALVAIGQILLSRNLPTEAIEYFQRTISKTNDAGLLITAHLGAGVSLNLLGKKLEGLEHLQKIPQFKEPEDPMEKACYFKGLVTLASALFNEGQKAEAAKYLRMAAAYDPSVDLYIKECEMDGDQ